MMAFEHVSDILNLQMTGAINPSKISIISLFLQDFVPPGNITLYAFLAF